MDKKQFILYAQETLVVAKWLKVGEGKYWVKIGMSILPVLKHMVLT